ncbi:MAG: hypothetical protein AAFR61_16920 [Bacteroidota bacterium]
MKPLTLIFGCLIVGFLSLYCEQAPLPPAAPETPNVTGVYSGQAWVRFQRIEYWDDTTLVWGDSSLEAETLTVLAQNVEQKTYEISKTIVFSSSYPITGEKQLSDSLGWASGFEYDKKWESSLDFKPEQDSVIARMYIRDIFEQAGYDSLGNIAFYYFDTREYLFRGKWQE